MKLGDAKRKVLMLLDEYSSGGAVSTDADIDAKMADFFDIGQKNLAGIQRIVRSFTPGADVQTPADFGGVFRVWKDGKLTKKYRWRGNTILIPADDMGRVEVEYFAGPQTISQDTKDEYEFEVSEDAAQCLAYFVAAQQLVTDLILDPAPLLALYDRMVSSLDLRLPGSGSAGIKQGFFRM